MAEKGGAMSAHWNPQDIERSAARMVGNPDRRKLLVDDSRTEIAEVLGQTPEPFAAIVDCLRRIAVWEEARAVARMRSAPAESEDALLRAHAHDALSVRIAHRLPE